MSAHSSPNRSFPATPPLERLVVIIAFVGLAITGLPQKFAAEAWAHGAFTLMGGIESTRILHRFFALLLIAEAIYHVAAFLYRRLVLAVKRPDGSNVIGATVGRFLANLGLRRTDASSRFAFRLEYWVIVLSAIFMIITGLALWKPVAVTNTLPADTIPLFRSLHSDHALALVVFLVVWRIGIALFWRPKPAAAPEVTASPAQIARRRAVFIPAALVVIAALTLVLFAFITSSQTAINTIVPHRQVIFAPQAMPAAGDPVVGAALWNTLRCAFCHGAEAQGGADGEPALRGTTVTFEAFYEQVRVGRGDMPAFSAEELPDPYVLHLYTYLTQPAQ